MRNLADHPHTTIYAAHELGGAGIPGEPCEPYGEPQATVLGVLGGFTFRRVWRYWVAEGRLPLEVAQRLYDEHEIARNWIRASGHCGCIRPGDPGARPTYLSPDGREVLHLTPEERAWVAEWGLENEGRYVWVETPEDLERLGEPYITCYHIDTPEALALFAQTLRALDTPSDPR